MGCPRWAVNGVCEGATASRWISGDFSGCDSPTNVADKLRMYQGKAISSLDSI
jgi:hypothetical protein